MRFIFSLLLFIPLIVFCKEIRIASYNVYNYCEANRYVDHSFKENYPKPESEKKVVQDVICSVDPDIIAFQEMGVQPYLEELQKDLERREKKYPYLAIMNGEDKDRHTAVLSRVPIKKMIFHKNLEFDYFTSKRKSKRGLLELVFETENKEWSLFVVHLKSRLMEDKRDPISDQFRAKEALVIREIIRKETIKNSAFMIVGDFNDTKQNRPLQYFFKINHKEFCKPLNCCDSRGESWTYFYSKAESYSRTDFILVSPELFTSVKGGKGRISDIDNFQKGSDHRLIYADFSFGIKEK